MLDKRLKLFELIWELKSFSAAAAVLGMSQPNATQQLKRLEQELGVRLFDRDTKSLRLTTEGRLVLDELINLNAAAEKLELKLSGLSKGIQNLALGGTLTAANYVLPSLISAFMRRHARIHLHLTVSNTVTIAEKIQQGFLELALVEGPFDRNVFDYYKFADDELLATGHPDFFRRPFCLSDYLAHGGILLLREPGSGTRFYFESFCRSNNISVPTAQIISIGSFEAIKVMAANKQGITFISPLACQIELQKGQLTNCRTTEGVLKRELNFISIAGSHNQLIAKFRNFCLKNPQ